MLMPSCRDFLHRGLVQRGAADAKSKITGMNLKSDRDPSETYLLVLAGIPLSGATS
jgi:hypothetical protein